MVNWAAKLTAMMKMIAAMTTRTPTREATHHPTDDSSGCVEPSVLPRFAAISAVSEYGGVDTHDTQQQRRKITTAGGAVEEEERKEAAAAAGISPPSGAAAACSMLCPLLFSAPLAAATGLLSPSERSAAAILPVHLMLTPPTPRLRPPRSLPPPRPPPRHFRGYLRPTIPPPLRVLLLPTQQTSIALPMPLTG